MDSVFVDTSAFYALAVARDPSHRAASQALARLERERAGFVTSSFVLVETVTLLQARTGVATVKLFRGRFLPIVRVHWLTEGDGRRAIDSLLAADRRTVSLTDWSSFLLMRDAGIHRAFAFDPHFAEQGFEPVA